MGDSAERFREAEGEGGEEEAASGEWPIGWVRRLVHGLWCQRRRRAWKGAGPELLSDEWDVASGIMVASCRVDYWAGRLGLSETLGGC